MVVHDFFDTLESSQIFLREVAKRHYGCQILLLNLPGQAFTTYNTGTTPAEQVWLPRRTLDVASCSRACALRVLCVRRNMARQRQRCR